MIRIQFSLFYFQPEIFSYSVSISFISSLNRRIPPLAYIARKAIVAIKVAVVRDKIDKNGKLVPVSQTSGPSVRRQPMMSLSVNTESFELLSGYSPA